MCAYQTGKYDQRNTSECLTPVSGTAILEKKHDIITE